MNRIYLYATDDPEVGPFEDRAEARDLSFAWKILLSDAPRLVRSPVYSGRLAVVADMGGLRHLQALLDRSRPEYARFFELWDTRPARRHLVLVPDEAMVAASALEAIRAVTSRTPGPDDAMRAGIGVESTSWAGVNFLSLTPEPGVPSVRPPRPGRTEPASKLLGWFRLADPEFAPWALPDEVATVRALVEGPPESDERTHLRARVLRARALSHGVIPWLEATEKVADTLHQAAPVGPPPPRVGALAEELWATPPEQFHTLVPAHERVVGALWAWANARVDTTSRAWAGGYDEADALWVESPAKAASSVVSVLGIVGHAVYPTLDFADPADAAWHSLMARTDLLRGSVTMIAALANGGTSLAANERAGVDAITRIERPVWESVYAALLYPHV